MNEKDCIELEFKILKRHQNLMDKNSKLIKKTYVKERRKRKGNAIVSILLAATYSICRTWFLSFLFMTFYTKQNAILLPTMTKKETHKPSLSATQGLNEANNISLYNDSQILVGSTIRKKSKKTCYLIKD